MLSKTLIQEINPDEGEIPTDLYQAAYEPFPSDVNSDHDSGFITDNDDEGNSEFKLCRMDIVNEMWESYLQYTANSDNNDFLIEEG